MKEFLFVFIGGGAGSVTRFLLQSFITRCLPEGKFPFGTMGVNIIGSLLIGMLFGITFNRPDNVWLKPLLITGFCGGFTTFSTFSNDSLQLLRSGETTHFMLYVLGSLAICIAATFAGYRLYESIAGA